MHRPIGTRIGQGRSVDTTSLHERAAQGIGCLAGESLEKGVRAGEAQLALQIFHPKWSYMPRIVPFNNQALQQ